MVRILSSAQYCASVDPVHEDLFFSEILIRCIMTCICICIYIIAYSDQTTFLHRVRTHQIYLYSWNKRETKNDGRPRKHAKHEGALSNKKKTKIINPFLSLLVDPSIREHSRHITSKSWVACFCIMCNIIIGERVNFSVNTRTTLDVVLRMRMRRTDEPRPEEASFGINGLYYNRLRTNRESTDAFGVRGSMWYNPWCSVLKTFSRYRFDRDPETIPDGNTRDSENHRNDHINLAVPVFSYFPDTDRCHFNVHVINSRTPQSLCFRFPDGVHLTVYPLMRFYSIASLDPLFVKYLRRVVDRRAFLITTRLLSDCWATTAGTVCETHRPKTRVLFRKYLRLYRQ